MSTNVTATGIQAESQAHMHNLHPTIKAHPEAEEGDDSSIASSPPPLDCGLHGLWPQGAGKRLASSGIHQAGSCQALRSDPNTLSRCHEHKAFLVVTLPVLTLSVASAGLRIRGALAQHLIHNSPSIAKLSRLPWWRMIS